MISVGAAEPRNDVCWLRGSIEAHGVFFRLKHTGARVCAHFSLTESAVDLLVGAQRALEAAGANGFGTGMQNCADSCTTRCRAQPCRTKGDGPPGRAVRSSCGDDRDTVMDLSGGLWGRGVGGLWPTALQWCFQVQEPLRTDFPRFCLHVFWSWGTRAQTTILNGSGARPEIAELREPP